MTYTTTYSGFYSNPGNTIKNNPLTTRYSLSISELIELCETYHEDYDDIEARSTAIELLVDYIVKSRK